ncbi:MAG: LysM peptidoglycan-binding domain-containing protein [Planctomycetota bacterium]
MGNIEKYGVAALAVIILMIVVISILDLRDSGKLSPEKGSKDNPATVRIAGEPEGDSGDPMLQSRVPVNDRWGKSDGLGLETKISGGQGGLYVVQKGDTPASIAKELLGSSQLHQLILDANPGTTAKNLQIGQKLIIPGRGSSSSGASTPVKPPVTAGGSKIHVVKDGETLGGISQSYFGTTQRWKDIQTLNGLPNANIRKGQELKIPAQ